MDDVLEDIKSSVKGMAVDAATDLIKEGAEYVARAFLGQDPEKARPEFEAALRKKYVDELEGEYDAKD